MTVHANTEQTRAIARAAFPDYTGRTIRICASRTVNCASYWAEGYRSYFVALDLATMRTSPPAQSAFDRTIAGLDCVTVPMGAAIVEHVIFCGRDSGITIHVHPDSLAPLLPATPTAIDPDVRTVLRYTRSYKNTYNGQTGVRFRYAARETGITADRWQSATATAMQLGYLTKAGAITDAGRNVLAC
jgi:hypothetical protein